jgi:hypothetical protein
VARRRHASVVLIAMLATVVVVVASVLAPGATRAFAATTYAEQEGHHGANTFKNYHNASGMGPRVNAAQWVQVSCKIHDPTIASVNPDGYWLCTVIQGEDEGVVHGDHVLV